MPYKALALGTSSSFKRHPSQNSILRSNYLNVVPFDTSEVRFKSTYHTAGFLGEGVPVFDIADYYISNDTQNMRIRKTRFGGALADMFSTPAIQLYEK